MSDFRPGSKAFPSRVEGVSVPGRRTWPGSRPFPVHPSPAPGSFSQRNNDISVVVTGIMAAKNKKRVNDYAMRNRNIAKKRGSTRLIVVSRESFGSPFLEAFATVGATNRVEHTADDGTKTPIRDFHARKRGKIGHPNPVGLLEALLTKPRGGVVEKCHRVDTCTGKPLSFGPSRSSIPTACVDCHDSEIHGHHWCDTCSDKAVWEVDGTSWCIPCAILAEADVSGVPELSMARMCRMCKQTRATYGTEKNLVCASCAAVVMLVLGTLTQRF